MKQRPVQNGPEDSQTQRRVENRHVLVWIRETCSDPRERERERNLLLGAASAVNKQAILIHDP